MIEALTSTPVVHLFNWRLPAALEIDASQKYVGAVPLQPHMLYHNNEIGPRTRTTSNNSRVTKLALLGREE